LLSVVAVVGTWVVGNSLSTAITQMLVVVENTAGSLSSVVGQVDQGITKLEETTTAIRSAADQLSQNITDQGLILTLLPEERQQELVAQANELKATVDTVLDALAAGLELYRTIDNLPFVSLPKPEEDSLARLETAITDIQSMVGQVTQGIQDFRDGVSQEIDRVTTVLDEINGRLDTAQEGLAKLDSILLALQDAAAQVREVVPLFFVLLGIFATLFFSWVIFTQVVVIRQYVQRWRVLGVVTVPVEALPAAEVQATSGAPEVSALVAAAVATEEVATEAAEETPVADLTVEESPEEITDELPALATDAPPVGEVEPPQPPVEDQPES
jgi:hypothetical protein